VVRHLACSGGLAARIGRPVTPAEAIYRDCSDRTRR
jgi:hypothetical protein